LALPRIGTHCSSGCEIASWATRRTEDVPIRRQLVQGEAAGVDQGVADVVAPQEGGEDGAGRQRAVGGHVLDAVHGQVGLAGQQCRVDLLGERPLAAEPGQVAHPAVAGGGDGHDLRTDLRPQRGQFGANPLHLGQGHGRGTGDDTDQLRGSHAYTIEPPTRAVPQPRQRT
jgi:hypothetical protein